MAVKVFAAILIGSTETELRVYELSSRKMMKQIDCVSKRINLGEDAYSDRRLDTDKVQELCQVLKEFRMIMEGYHVDEARVCATSAFREIRSAQITRDYIEKQTGLTIRTISNSEQRFLDYMSIACESSSFEKIIQSGTAIVDIGGNSMQISVFDKDKLITTQNIPIGKVSARADYYTSAKNNRHYEALMKELLEHELNGFAKLYQKDRQIRNLIIVDNDLHELVKRRYEDIMRQSRTDPSDVFQIPSKDFDPLYQKMMQMSPDDLAWQFELSIDSAQLVMQSAMFCRIFLEKMAADTLWLMDVNICDGLCYDYGVTNKLLRVRHNFEDDILAASRIISKRYKCSQPHVKNMEELCTEIFSKLKKIHGLSAREKLLLQIAAILHNCGKYISLKNVSECAYNIIMATEIIGLSHDERRIIANVVKYNTSPFPYYDESDEVGDLSREEYLMVAKLTAILRIANALDRSHKQKCHGAVISLKDRELVITVETKEDLTLEKLALEDQSDFFDEVFSIHPVIHHKKKM